MHISENVDNEPRKNLYIYIFTMFWIPERVWTLTLICYVTSFYYCTYFVQVQQPSLKEDKSELSSASIPHWKSLSKNLAPHSMLFSLGPTFKYKTSNTSVVWQIDMGFWIYSFVNMYFLLITDCLLSVDSLRVFLSLITNARCFQNWCLYCFVSLTHMCNAQVSACAEMNRAAQFPGADRAKSATEQPTWRPAMRGFLCLVLFFSVISWRHCCRLFHLL